MSTPVPMDNILTPKKRVVFTGGSGIAGRHVIEHLASCGFEILNLDIAPLPGNIVHTIKTDLTQSGQVFNGLTSHFKLTQPFLEPVRIPDAVIHFAGVPRNLLVPDDELFRTNALSAYNVLEAACKLGVKKIILASSVAVYGVTFAEGNVEYASFPADEALDVNPMDTYSISKVCMEKVARGFARRFGIDVYVLRLGAVITPDDYESSFRDYNRQPESWKGHGWSYIDARDLGQMCRLGVEINGLGFQIFNATNDEITHDTPAEEFLSRVCPNTPFTRSLGRYEAPLSNRKIKELLGFRENYGWRKLFPIKGYFDE